MAWVQTSTLLLTIGSQLTSVYLSFPLCKMGIMIIPSQKVVRMKQDNACEAPNTAPST